MQIIGDGARGARAGHFVHGACERVERQQRRAARAEVHADRRGVRVHQRGETAAKVEGDAGRIGVPRDRQVRMLIGEVTLRGRDDGAGDTGEPGSQPHEVA